MAFERFKSRRNSTIDEAFKPDEGSDILQISGLIGKTLLLHGFIVTKDTGYGEGVLLAASFDGGCYFVSVPKRYVSVFKECDEEEVVAMKEGRAVVSNIRTYTCRNGKETTLFDIDMI